MNENNGSIEKRQTADSGLSPLRSIRNYMLPPTPTLARLRAGELGEESSSRCRLPIPTPKLNGKY